MSTPSELAQIRTELDALDLRLFSLLAERQRLIERVIDFKRRNSLGVVDRQREDEMLDQAEKSGRAVDLDPRVARQVLRAIIDAFTLLEVEDLEP